MMSINTSSKLNNKKLNNNLSLVIKLCVKNSLCNKIHQTLKIQTITHQKWNLTNQQINNQNLY